MEHYSHVIIGLEEDLEQIVRTSDHVLNTTKLAIGRCRAALVELRRMVIDHGFPSTQEEIFFFKKIKPVACSKLIYYQAVFEMESIRLDLGAGSLRKYFRREQKRILGYMKMNKRKVQYYRCGHSHLDEKYFLRGKKEIPLELKDSFSLMDEDFFTWQDQTFSNIMANEMLMDYIKKEIRKLNAVDGQSIRESNLRWTGNKIDLYELIYAIYFDGSVNNGKATIKDLVEVFGWMFNADLQKGIYKTQDQLIERADPVRFLSHLVATLRRRIDHKLK